MAQAIQARDAHLEAGLPGEKAKEKGFSRLDLVEKVSEVARLLEDTVGLQNRKRENLLEQKEYWLNKNIKAVSGKGRWAMGVATFSLCGAAIFSQGAKHILKNDQLAAAMPQLVAAVTPSVQQMFDGCAPGHEFYRVEAELRGAQVDQDTQQLTTDIQKSRETAQGFEGAVRSAATFYGR